jgi:hypothetical protein
MAVELFNCPECGNARPWRPESCPHCGSGEPPTDGPEYVAFNLELDGPTVEDALRTTDRILDRAITCGIRGLILIHGHGSSGRGGSIRKAFREGLERNFWAHKVTEYAHGEDLRPSSPAYTSLVERRPALRQALRREFLGNAGITVLLLKKAP